MGPSSPLRKLQERADARFTTFPPPDSVFAGDASRVEVVACYSDVEAELRSLVHGVGLFEAAYRRVLVATGSDRIEFLNRMLTQELKDLEPWRCADSFWLNRKGRIEADLRVLHQPDQTWLITDAPVAASALATLESFIITEDAALADVGDRWSTLALIGPRAGVAADRLFGDGMKTSALNADELTAGQFEGETIIAERATLGGQPAIWLHTPTHLAEAVFDQLVGKELESDVVMPVGLDAIERLRIQAGEPRFLIDFGTTSLPHETGLLYQRVSFRKGCYLGQEVVARMHSLGQPKQKMARLRLAGPTRPHVGDNLLIEASGESVGVLTSVTEATDGSFVGLGQVRTKHAAPGANLRCASGAICTIADLVGEAKP